MTYLRGDEGRRRRTHLRGDEGKEDLLAGEEGRGRTCLRGDEERGRTT